MSRTLRRPVHGHRFAPAAVLLAALLTSSAALAQPAQGASFTAAPDGFHGPTSLTAGWNRIDLVDQLGSPVGLQIVRLVGSPSDADVAAAMAANIAAEGTAGEVAAGRALLALVVPVGGPTAVPGHPGTAWIQLEPGAYAVTTANVDADGKPLAARPGFYRRVTVVAGEAGQAPPPAEYEATLVDFDIELPDTIAAGAHLWRVHDQGAEPHHMMVFRLADGATADDVKAWLEANPAQADRNGPPPGEFVGSTTVLAPGLSEVTPLMLTPGSYVALCFMVDPSTGKDHWELGMFRPFQVTGSTSAAR